MTELKGFNQVVEAVELVCKITFFLFVKQNEQGNDSSWPVLKGPKLLGSGGLLNDLKSFDISQVRAPSAANAKKNIALLIRKMGGLEGQELVSALKGKSIAAAGLWKWACATDKYYDIFRMVEPKKKLAEEMQAKKEKSEAQLNATLAALAEVEA